MDVVVLDFETFFTDAQDERGIAYKLQGRGGTGYPTEAYVRHPWFEAHGAAIKWSPSVPARWYPEKELRYVLKEHDWSNTFLINHHANFDGFILSHRYGVIPKLYGCTLNMARLLLGNHIGVSLDSVREQFGIPLKKTPYNLFRGKHWYELDSSTQELIGDGACDEVESIWRVFGEMTKTFPSAQFEVVDILIRMFVNPVLQGDSAFFGKVWEAEARKKQELLQKLSLTEADLQSGDRFADLLRQQGVEPEMKEGKNGPIYAFAKNDGFLKNLPEHENETVSLLAQARLGVKSTIQQTRAATLGWMSSRGALPVYIRAYGARTTRPSGGDGSNFLNMKKADPDMPPDDTNTNLKGGICAPEGYLLAPIDSSQIECRLLNEVAGQHDVIEKFRNGEDVYSTVASAFYGYPVNKNDHKTERQVGKVVELQAGYGSGGAKILATLRNKAKIILPPERGNDLRDAYRNTHPAVVKLWWEGGRMLERLANRESCSWGPVEIRDGRMWLPNGSPIIFDTLQWHHDEESGEHYWRLKTRKGWEKTYGAKAVENLIQGLAWNLVSDAMVRINRLGYRTLNCPYDELLILIPRDGQEAQHLQRCKDEMTKPPPWLPNLPLGCDGELRERYG